MTKPSLALALAHVHLKVRNLKKAEAFYTSLLGFKVRERVGHYLFLTLGNHHHDLALQEHPDALPQLSNTVGLYHIAFEVKNEHELARILKKLISASVHFETQGHGISKAVYFSDPDGNGIEIYCDTRKKNKQSLWRGYSGGTK